MLADRPCLQLRGDQGHPCWGIRVHICRMGCAALTGERSSRPPDLCRPPSTSSAWVASSDRCRNACTTRNARTDKGTRGSVQSTEAVASTLLLERLRYAV